MHYTVKNFIVTCNHIPMGINRKMEYYLINKYEHMLLNLFANSAPNYNPNSKPK